MFVPRLPARGPTRSLSRFLEPQKVVLLQESRLLSEELKAALFDLTREDLLPRPDMAENPLRALAFDAAEVDDDEFPARFQRPVNGFERMKRVLEMMVRVADEREIHGILRKLYRASRADHTG